MSERPTPETDALIKYCFGFDEEFVPARKLGDMERQRDEARESARELLAELGRLSRWHFPNYADDCGIIAEIDSVIGKFEEGVKP